MRLENWLYTIPLRLRSLLVRHRQDEDLDEELRDHIERQTRENQSRGMGEEQARLAALRAFGSCRGSPTNARNLELVDVGAFVAGLPSRTSLGAACAAAFIGCRACPGPRDWPKHWRVHDCECGVSQESNAR